MRRLLLLATALAALPIMTNSKPKKASIAHGAMVEHLPQIAKPETVCAELKDSGASNAAQMKSGALQDAMYRACLDNERQMRPWLEHNWSTVPGGTRNQCLKVTSSHQGLDAHASGYGAALLASCVANVEHKNGQTALCQSLEKIEPGLTTCAPTSPPPEGPRIKLGDSEHPGVADQ